MKLLILSDLHLEFGNIRNIDTADADVVILAGDIHVGSEGVVWAQKTFDKPVIYVAGNHEFYGHKRFHKEHLENMRKLAEGSNVHFLENNAVVIDGVKFVGATLWTDYDLFGSKYVSGERARVGLNDFYHIRKNEHERINPDYIMEVNAESKMFIGGELNDGFDGKIVVVTHHAPSIESSLGIYRTDPLTPAYASRLEHMMMYSQNNPVLWVHGHMHNSSDYIIGDTRVVVNPRGYAGHALNDQFDIGRVIEI